ncbi:hypothetical protein ACFFRR_000891 [Megaselia abdita]
MPAKAALFLSGVALISFTGYLIHKYPDFFLKQSCSSEYIHKLSEHYQIKDFKHNRNSFNETVLNFFVTEDDPYFRIEDQQSDFNIFFEYSEEHQTANFYVKHVLCNSLKDLKFSKTRYTKLSVTFQNVGIVTIKIEGEHMKRSLNCEIGAGKLSNVAVLTIGYKNSDHLEKIFFDCPRKFNSPWRYITSFDNNPGVTVKRSGPFEDVTITKNNNGNVEIKKNLRNLFNKIFLGWSSEGVKKVQVHNNLSDSGNRTFDKNIDKEVFNKDITINRGHINISKNDEGVRVDKSLKNDEESMENDSFSKGITINRGPLENINISKNDEGVQVDKSLKNDEESMGNDSSSKDITINRGLFGNINISKNNEGVRVDKSLENDEGSMDNDSF